MIEKINMNIPLFKGFYENVLYGTNSIDYEVKEEIRDSIEENGTVKNCIKLMDGYFTDRQQNDFTEKIFNRIISEKDFFAEDFFRIDEYRNDIAQGFVNIIRNYLMKAEFCKDIEFVEIISPRYYNYTNDKISTNFITTKEMIKNLNRYIRKHLYKFNKYIKKNFTSYDGFISYYPNNARDFLREGYNNSIVLEYALTFYLINNWNLTEADIVFEMETCIYSYIEEKELLKYVNKKIKEYTGE